MSIIPTHEEAERLESEGHWSEAVAMWTALAEKTPSAQLLLRQGRALEKAEQPVRAEEALRASLAMDSKNARTYFALGMLLNEQDRLTEAKAALEHGLDLQESQPILTILGSVLIDLEETSRAEEKLRRSLELDSEDDEAHYLLALVLQHTDEEQAILHLREAIRIDSTEGARFRELGWLLWKHGGELKAAEDAVREALVRDPDDPWARDYLGHLLSFRSDYVGARVEFERATELEPDNGFFLSNLAESWKWLGDPARAELLFRRALALGIGDKHTNLKYGLLLKDMGRFDRAVPYLQRVLAQDPAERRAIAALTQIEAKTKSKP